MNSWPPHLYQKFGREKGLSDKEIQQALSAAHKVQGRGLPAILSLNHLARHVKVSYGYLRAVVARRRDEAYRAFKIRKLSGGNRTICVPEPALLRTQRWLNRHILSKTTIHDRSYAYAPESSALACATMHCSCKWLIKLDIRQFFESISEIQVYRVFSGLGYAPLVSFELARICTRISSHSRTYNKEIWQAHSADYSIIDYSEHHSGWIGHLPQGAPTSPMLSNIVMYDFDDAVQKLADANGLYYTRYSDDLMFSTALGRLNRKTVVSFVGQVFKIMKRVGLRPHTSKTVIAPPGARKVVLGLLVDQDHPRLTHEFKSGLRQHFHFIEKFGPVEHALRRNFDSVWGLRNHLQGLLSYAITVEPEFGKELLGRFNQIDWSE